MPGAELDDCMEDCTLLEIFGLLALGGVAFILLFAYVATRYARKPFDPVGLDEDQEYHNDFA